MTNVRAYGADATLLACRETTYGVAPLSGYRSLDFKSSDLSAEQPLGDDPLLGRGRNAQDPYRGLITDEGAVDIPLDLRGTGFWLTGLFGDPTTTQTKAAGYVAFAGQPVANSSIVLNGVTWTFVGGTPTGTQTQIGANLDATLTALAADLDASADAEVAKCTYTANTDLDRLKMEFDTAGIAGNAFTLSASANSNGTTSGPTLTGGGYQHVWTSGGDAIPSYTVEVGHPKLVVPVFFRHRGTVMESLAFELGQQGPVNAKLQLVAQGEQQAAATIDASPSAYSLKRFTQARGFVRKGGAPLAGITGGSLSFSNNLERVRVIRDDGQDRGGRSDHRHVQRIAEGALRWGDAGSPGVSWSFRRTAPCSDGIASVPPTGVAGTRMAMIVALAPQAADRPVADGQDRRGAAGRRATAGDLTDRDERKYWVSTGHAIAMAVDDDPRWR